MRGDVGSWSKEDRSAEGSPFSCVCALLGACFSVCLFLCVCVSRSVVEKRRNCEEEGLCSKKGRGKESKAPRKGGGKSSSPHSKQLRKKRGGGPRQKKEASKISKSYIESYIKPAARRRLRYYALRSLLLDGSDHLVAPGARVASIQTSQGVLRCRDVSAGLLGWFDFDRVEWVGCGSSCLIDASALESGRRQTGRLLRTRTEAADDMRDNWLVARLKHICLPPSLVVVCGPAT